jgi:putative FmdB family regulatory protein
MPLYEYVCARCSKTFEELTFGATCTPTCPQCAQNDEVSKVPFAKLILGKKEDLRPPFIKGTTPRRR